MTQQELLNVVAPIAADCGVTIHGGLEWDGQLGAHLSLSLQGPKAGLRRFCAALGFDLATIDKEGRFRVMSDHPSKHTSVAIPMSPPSSDWCLLLGGDAAIAHIEAYAEEA